MALAWSVKVIKVENRGREWRGYAPKLWLPKFAKVDRSGLKGAGHPPLQPGLQLLRRGEEAQRGALLAGVGHQAVLEGAALGAGQGCQVLQGEQLLEGVAQPPVPASGCAPAAPGG